MKSGLKILNLFIPSGNTNDSFVLKPNTSSSHFAIFTTQPLDREYVSEYLLLVKAINLDEHARNSTVAVNISVVDLNDNAPHFNRRSYDVNVLENTTLGKVVLVLNARDEDKGVNANISYTLLAGSGVYTFSLDKVSGKMIHIT